MHLLAIICKLRKRHSWEAFEAYHGEWFLVCAFCKRVKSLTGKS